MYAIAQQMVQTGSVASCWSEEHEHRVGGARGGRGMKPLSLLPFYPLIFSVYPRHSLQVELRESPVRKVVNEKPSM
jgi:hypothetical protein